MTGVQYSEVNCQGEGLLPDHHSRLSPGSLTSKPYVWVLASLLLSGTLAWVVLTAGHGGWPEKPRDPFLVPHSGMDGEVLGLSSASSADPINAFNDRLDSVKFEGSGLYYEFGTANGELVLSGEVEGKPGSWANATTPIPMASASKLFTAFAAMYTMQLRPRDFYPEKLVNTFKGWETFKNFPVHGTHRRANLTIHHLLTHTSGLPFAMRDSKKDIQKQTLFYMPGTAFGYTLGHRVAGWILRDYWRDQPEARSANIKTVGDTFRWLYFEKMGLSRDTKFDDTMKQLFGYSGQAGDAAIQSTGEDLMKLAVVALRRGQLPNGKQLISEKNWNKWAVPNLLPGGRLSKDLVAWRGAAGSWANWNVGGVKEQIMKQSGDYGWNYFGATYYDSKEIGWCGFFSSCLRVSYPQDVAFVMMQRDTADLKKSKPYVVEHFDAMSKSLQCTQKSCSAARSATVFCETCKTSGMFTKTRSCQDRSWSRACPTAFKRSKNIRSDKRVDSNMHSCYVPKCHHATATTNPAPAGLAVVKEGTIFELGQACYGVTGTGCGSSACNASLGATCMANVCGCVAGCAGADNKCHAGPMNQLVAAGFTLTNAKWSKYKMYVQAHATFGQIKTTNDYSWMNGGKDKFSIYRLPGAVGGAPRFFLGSALWAGTVVRIASTMGTAFERHGLYATGLNEGKAPQTLAVTVCSLAKPAGAIMIGSAAASPIWAYMKHGSWYVYGYQHGDPKEGGYWMPDPPFPAGAFPACH